ncbi:helix-turn-helix transcriptional regulator [Paenibacillus sp. Y412MC10]|uniref:helix-turn-helix domain-containing protein n=1 Tax=Geobacillus sp. (strain Y412MC10) TaxID=481743 RepID=UPI0011A04D6A|nr:helix-turn-helix transcriptional regulator [Paenibacillus sp. Y412MC10]
MRLHIKLQEVLDERGLKQKELAALTGIRLGTISEICNNRRSTINREHLEIIAEKLDITEVNELLVFTN